MRTRAYWSSLFLCPVLFCARINDSGGDSPAVAQAVVGPQGGLVAADGATVVVAPGQLASPVTLTLTAVSVSPDAGAYSGRYRLEGLPEQFGGVVAVKLRYDRPLAASSFVGVSFVDTPRSLDSAVETFRYVEATDSAGYLCAELDFGRQRPALSTVSKAAAAAASRDAVILKVESGLERTAPTQPQGGGLRFEAIYRRPDIPDSFAEKTASYLNSAAAYYASAGFTYDARTSASPFPVYIVNDSSSDDFAYYNKGFPFTINGSYISVNYAKLAGRDEELRATLAHELFHFVHACHGLFDNATWWYQEALCTWAEEVIQPDPQAYYSPQLSTFYQCPFFGLEAGKAWYDPVDKVVSPARHGYGCGALVRALMHTSADSGKGRCFDLVSLVAENGLAPVEALRRAFSDFDAVWRGYFDSYFTGRLPFINAATIRETNKINPASDRVWTVADAADTMKTYTESMADLSVSVYWIHLDRTFGNDERLDVTFTAGQAASNMRLAAYAYRNRMNSPPPVSVGRTGGPGSDSLVIDSLGTLKNNCTSIIVTLVNGNAAPPFDTRTPAQIRFNFRKKLDLTVCNGVAIVVAGPHDIGASTPKDQFMIYNRQATPSTSLVWTSATSFSVRETERPAAGYSVCNDITIAGTLSPDLSRIVSATALHVRTTYANPDSVLYVETTRLEVADIPQATGSHVDSYAFYLVRGAASADHVRSIEYSFRNAAAGIDTKRYAASSWGANSAVSVNFQLK